MGSALRKRTAKNTKESDDKISLDCKKWDEDDTWTFLAYYSKPEELEFEGKRIRLETTEDGYLHVNPLKTEKGQTTETLSRDDHGATAQSGVLEVKCQRAKLTDSIIAETSRQPLTVEMVGPDDSRQQLEASHHEPESNNKSERDIRIEIVGKVIRSNWKNLERLPFSEVAPSLLQDKLINYEDYEEANNIKSAKTEREAMTNVLLKVRKQIEMESELFEKFCNTLQRCSTKFTYDQVTAQYQQLLKENGLSTTAIEIVGADVPSKVPVHVPTEVSKEEEPPVRPKRTVCRPLPDDHASPFHTKPAANLTTLDLGQLSMGDRNGLSELHRAVLHNQGSTVAKILNDGRSTCQIDALSANGNSAMHIGARLGHTTIVKDLLDHGANTKLQNKRKQRTPLHTACAYEKLEVAKLLIQNADKECLAMRDKNGDTPMHTVCKRGNVAIAKELLHSKKCDIYCKNSQKLTPLHYATHRSNDKLVRMLVTYDKRIAHLNSQDKDGRSVVHVASEKGSPGILNFLVKHDKKKLLRDTTNDEGQTPIAVAKDKTSRHILGKRKYKNLSSKRPKMKRSLSESVSLSTTTPPLSPDHPSTQSLDMETMSLSSTITSGSSLYTVPSTTSIQESMCGDSSPALSIAGSLEAPPRDVLFTSPEGSP